MIYNEYLVCIVTGGRWKIVEKNLEYVWQQEGISEFALIFSEYIGFNDFVYLVKVKIGLLYKFEISLHFHHPKLHCI